MKKFDRDMFVIIYSNCMLIFVEKIKCKENLFILEVDWMNVRKSWEKKLRFC